MLALNVIISHILNISPLRMALDIDSYWFLIGYYQYAFTFFTISIVIVYHFIK